MSEENVVNETLALVKEAQKQGTFNLAEAIKGRGYPEKDVIVYTDLAAAFALVETEAKLKSVPKGKDTVELEKQAQGLAETVQASKLVFSMRGVGELVVDQAEKEASIAHPDVDGERSDDWWKFYMAYLIGANIVKVTNADGEVDDHMFTTEDAVAIRNFIPSESWTLLVAAMQQLTLASGYFQGLTDAGFLPKS